MGFFDLFKKKPVAPKISVSVRTESYDSEAYIAKGCTITRLDLGGYTSPSGGHLNWVKYKVQGKNLETGRKNTRRYEARDEAAAADLARKDGLGEPFTFTPEAHDPPTERQIDYLKSWGVEVPGGCVKYDVSAILSRLEDSNDIVSSHKRGGKIIETVRPLPSPTEEFAMYAHEMGLMFSKYISQDALFDRVVANLDDREKAAFFAYCVLCTREGKAITDPRKSAHTEMIYAFADSAMQNESVMRSILERSSGDYIKPHKGTVAYKAVKAHFGID